MARTLWLSLFALTACKNEQDLGVIPPDPDPLPDTADTSRPIDTVDPDTDLPTDTDLPLDETQPVAVCSVEPTEVTPPFEDATFKGSQSYDPLGHAITVFNWSLVAVPNGSAVVMPGGNAANRTVRPDLAGDYIGRLVVTTDDGRVSAPCETFVSAVPGTDLWVEMFWTHRGDDMDLHLLAPGGTPRSRLDCYYMNTAPQWGDSSTRTDDPRLDLDDIPGTGPENINIAEPYDGTYTVFVHDYPGSSYTPANDVTVNIYIGGTLQFTSTRTISGEDSDNYFADIVWAGTTGTVVPR